MQGLHEHPFGSVSWKPGQNGLCWDQSQLGKASQLGSFNHQCAGGYILRQTVNTSISDRRLQIFST